MHSGEGLVLPSSFLYLGWFRSFPKYSQPNIAHWAVGAHLLLSGISAGSLVCSPGKNPKFRQSH